MPPILKSMVNLGETGNLSSYLSRPNDTNSRPAVMVIHEWWGLTPHMKDVADRCASLGYVTLAPDLFGGVTTTAREEAMKLSSSVSKQESAQKIESALDYLKRSNFVKPNRIGTLGFCFGGMHEFNFLCVSRDIAAAAIYYPSRTPNEELLANISAPLLIFYGDQDSQIKSAYELESTLKTLGKEFQLLIYPGAGHAFFNDQWHNYNQEAAKDAWERTVAFFGSSFS